MSINVILKELAGLLNISHIALYRTKSNDLQENELIKINEYVCSDLFERKSKKDFENHINLEKNLLAWYKRMVVQKNAVNEIVRMLPVKEKKVFEYLGIQSVLYVPIFFEEKLWGGIQLFDYKSEKYRSFEEIRFLYVLGKMIANRIEYETSTIMVESSMKQLESFKLGVEQSLKDLSHQIKTPLSIIELNLGMLINFKSQIQEQDKKNFQNKTDRIDRAVADMKKIVESCNFVTDQSGFKNKEV